MKQIIVFFFFLLMGLSIKAEVVMPHNHSFQENQGAPATQRLEDRDHKTLLRRESAVGENTGIQSKRDVARTAYTSLRK